MRIAIALALTALAVRFWWQPMYGLTIPSSHGLLSYRAQRSFVLGAAGFGFGAVGGEGPRVLRS